MVGGSTRIPEVLKRVSEFFDGKELNKSAHPDECVATGAALLGHMIATGHSDAKQFCLTSHSFGVEKFIDGVGDELDVIIPNGCPYPVEKSREYVTHADDQTMMLVKIQCANKNDDSEVAQSMTRQVSGNNEETKGAAQDQ